MSELVHLPLQDPHFVAEFVRIANHASDLPECAHTASRVRDGNPDSWHDAWKELADAVRDDANGSLDQGCEISAREGFLRATEYYRASAFPLLDGPRIAAAYQNMRESFEAALDLFDAPAHHVEIPYDDTTLPGYFFCADTSGEPAPLLMVTGNTAEEGYFSTARPALERGYNVLTIEGPGQGRALFERGLTLRPDFEHPLSQILDWAIAQEVVDPQRVILIGRDFGGYLAARGACFEDRLAALVCDPLQMTPGESLLHSLPEGVSHMLGENDQLGIDTFFRDLFEKSPTQKFQWQSQMAHHGVTSVYQHLCQLQQYTLADHTGGISCPSLVFETSNTGSLPWEATRFPSTDSPTRFARLTFDWLDLALAAVSR